MSELSDEQREWAQQIDYEEQERRPTYQGLYSDPHGNRWRVDLTGTNEAVANFLEPRSFYLEATPASPEEVEAAAAEALEMSAPDQEAAKDETTAEQGETYASEAPGGLPELEVAVTLEAVAAPTPLHVHFMVDPEISGGSHDYRFTLLGEDATASTSFSTAAGRVRVTLSGPGGSGSRGPSSAGSIAIRAASTGSSWSVRVDHSSGSPAIYTLTGDLYVP
jgi:hypothetical protein